MNEENKQTESGCCGFWKFLSDIWSKDCLRVIEIVLLALTLLAAVLIGYWQNRISSAQAEIVGKQMGLEHGVSISVLFKDDKVFVENKGKSNVSLKNIKYTYCKKGESVCNSEVDTTGRKLEEAIILPGTPTLAFDLPISKLVKQNSISNGNYRFHFAGEVEGDIIKKTYTFKGFIECPYGVLERKQVEIADFVRNSNCFDDNAKLKSCFNSYIAQVDSSKIGFLTDQCFSSFESFKENEKPAEQQPKDGFWWGFIWGLMLGGLLVYALRQIRPLKP